MKTLAEVVEVVNKELEENLQLENPLEFNEYNVKFEDFYVGAHYIGRGRNHTRVRNTYQVESLRDCLLKYKYKRIQRGRRKFMTLAKVEFLTEESNSKYLDMTAEELESKHNSLKKEKEEAEKRVADTNLNEVKSELERLGLSLKDFNELKSKVDKLTYEQERELNGESY